MQLPEDILSDILYHISLLPAGGTTLSACALSSKSLLDPAHRLLFSTIHLSCDIRHQSAQLDHILSINPTLGSYVRTLVISERVSRGHDQLLMHGARMARILNAMTGVREVEVRTYVGMMDWSGFCEPLKRAFVGLFRGETLCTLKVCNMLEFPISAIVGAVGLKNLVFDNVVPSDSDSFEDIPKESTRPTSIHFSLAMEVATGLLKATKIPSIPFSLCALTSLRVAPTSPPELLAFRSILASFGRYDELAELEYSFTGIQDPLHMPDILPLTALPHLRSLSLFIPQAFLSNPTFPTLCANLTTAPPTNTLHTLAITIASFPFSSKSSKSSIIETDWGHLDTILLDGKRFAQLRKVVVRVELRKNPMWRRGVSGEAVKEWEEVAREVIKAKMGRCVEVGIQVGVVVVV